MSSAEVATPAPAPDVAPAAAEATPTKADAPGCGATPQRLNAKAQSFVPNMIGASPARSQPSNKSSPAPATATKPLSAEAVSSSGSAPHVHRHQPPSTEKKNLPSPMAPNLLQQGGATAVPVPYQAPMYPMPYIPAYGVGMVPPGFVGTPAMFAPPPPPPWMFINPPTSPFTFGPPPPSPFFSAPGSNLPSFHQFMITMHKQYMRDMANASPNSSSDASPVIVPAKTGVAAGTATPPPPPASTPSEGGSTAKRGLNPASGEYIPQSPTPPAEAAAAQTSSSEAGYAPNVDLCSSVFVPGRGMVPSYLLGPGHQPLAEEEVADEDAEDESSGMLPHGVTPQLFEMYFNMWRQLQAASFANTPKFPPHAAATPASTKAKAAATPAPASPMMGMRSNSEVVMGSPSISVGNATFQALTSKEPPKFACVLVIGLPSSGKTTVSRQLVSELVEEKFAWEFFSGSEHIPEATLSHRPPTWETTKAVFDALSNKIDSILQGQKFSTTPVRGLLIDKNVKGIEDVYYLYALLKKKGVQLNGIINFDSHDDDKLAQRVCNGNSANIEPTKEKFKYYRAILSRVMESTKGSNLWHSIDVNEDLHGVVKHLRSKVLGCSVMQNTKPLYICNYTERNASMVHNYVEYAQVMNRVSMFGKTPKPNQFPGQVSFAPLTTTVMSDHSQVRNIKESFVARRKIDGTQYVLFHDEGSAKLYLIPRHMRAVLRIPAEGWMGVRLDATGTFLLDGELVPLQADRTKEKFLVHDVIFWTEKGETENSCKGSWKVRQERLQSFMINEALPFQQKRTDIIVAYQHFAPVNQIARLFGPAEYSSEGIVFQSTSKKEHAFLWRAPDQLTVDFRLGSMHPDAVVVGTGEKIKAASAIKDGFPNLEITVSFDLEVFCQKAKKYVSYDHYGGVSVSCAPKHHIPVPGSIVSCYLVINQQAEQAEGGARKKPSTKSWKFHQLRSDVPTSMFKSAVDSLVDEGVVTLADLVEWLRKNELVSPASVKDIEDAAKARKAQLANAAAGNVAVPPAHVFPPSTDAVLMQQYYQNLRVRGNGAPQPPLAPALPSMRRQSSSHGDGMVRQGSTVLATTPPPLAGPSMRDILVGIKPSAQAAAAPTAQQQRHAQVATESADAFAAKQGGAKKGESASAGKREERGSKGRVLDKEERRGGRATKQSTSDAPKPTAAAAQPAEPTAKKTVEKQDRPRERKTEVTATHAKVEKKAEAAPPAGSESDGDDEGDSPSKGKAEKRRGRRGGRKEREKRERREARAGGSEGGTVPEEHAAQPAKSENHQAHGESSQQEVVKEATVV